MIRHELQQTALRFYQSDSDDPFEPYSAVCTLMWESPNTVWIKGMHGTLTRKMLRELITFFRQNHIHRVKAHRALDRTIPFITSRDGTSVEVDVSSIPWKDHSSSSGTTSNGSTILGSSE